MDAALLKQITSDIMNSLLVSIPVVDNLPTTSIKLPWWVTTPPEDLYIYSRKITGGDDVFNGVAMGLTVKPDAEIFNLFVAPSVHLDQFGTKNILTSEGYKRYKQEGMGNLGWPMLKLFGDFAQRTQNKLSEGTQERLVKFLDERAVDQIEYMFFDDFDSRKRWREGEKTKKTLRQRWRWPLENEERFNRLTRPLIPPHEFGYSSDNALILFDILSKVKQGIFEQSGDLCNYKRSAHRTEYQNFKKKGERVISLELNNAWALFLTAGLKLRVTIWSESEGHGDVQVVNNDEIIKDLWARELVENPDIIEKFDQVLMCRPLGGMLRAVQRNIPDYCKSNWSKLNLIERNLIPGNNRSGVEEAVKPAPLVEEDEESDSSEDDQHHVMWKKEPALNVFEVTIGSEEIFRFLDYLSAQLTFHIRADIYFNTSTHARIAIKISDSQKEKASIDITKFIDRVTKDQYWREKAISNIPTGYHIMPQFRRYRENVVWFLPLDTTSHILSFLKVNLTFDLNSMKGSFYVTHVTENRQVLQRDETYRVITLENVATFAIILLELHKSDYKFCSKEDRPNQLPKDITILKFKIPHPAYTGKTSDAKWKRVVASQTNRIIAALSKFVDLTHCSGTDLEDTEISDFYVHRFISNSNKHMSLSIHIHEDIPYTEITLEQLSI